MVKTKIILLYGKPRIDTQKAHKNAKIVENVVEREWGYKVKPWAYSPKEVMA